jgi:6,7-dimethyl-8-ribityllumazine synthase
VGEYAPPPEPVDASGMRIAVVAGRFNDQVTKPLLDGALSTLDDHGLAADAVPVHWVPGAFEIPIVAQRLAATHAYDALICLGAVIRGNTPHFEFVAGECAAGIARVALKLGVPCSFGVLTTDSLDQALARCGGDEGNKGAEAARTAIEMAALLRRLPHPGTRGEH